MADDVNNEHQRAMDHQREREAAWHMLPATPAVGGEREALAVRLGHMSKWFTDQSYEATTLREARDALAAPPASPLRGRDEDWRDDPSSDERWNAGVDCAMKLFCDYLGVDPDAVTWDAATETVDGDISAVIGNILRAKFGEDY
jgi:hypothetical protein